MADTATDPSIDAYLQAARDLWHQNLPELPAADQLRDLALQVDMSDQASEAADRRSRDLSVEAGELLSDDQAEPAEPLLRDALLLSPLRVQPWYLLARIYGERQGASGDAEDRQIALALANRAQSIAPAHEPTRSLLEQLGTTPQAGLPWRKAMLIVLAIVLISGTLQVCHRYFVAPDVSEDQLEKERQFWENQPPPE